MTLKEIRAQYSELFHPNQNWFEGENFMEEEIPDGELELPSGKVYGDARQSRATAVELAALYITNPRAEIFLDYLWCKDVDREGQRVYVGGTRNGKGFEIHRHIHITERFGVPVW